MNIVWLALCANGSQNVLLHIYKEYKHLRKRYWDQHFWVRGHWVASSGNVTDEVWKEYIKKIKPPEPFYDFYVV